MRGSGIEETAAFLLMEKEKHFHRGHHHQELDCSRLFLGYTMFLSGECDHHKMQGREAGYWKEDVYIGPSQQAAGRLN